MNNVSNMKVLHLNLKKEWYNMIESGDKCEEYREIKPFWEKRLIGKNYTHVCFIYGYTKRRMTYPITGIDIGMGNPKWGAPEKNVFIISFDKSTK